MLHRNTLRKRNTTQKRNTIHRNTITLCNRNSGGNSIVPFGGAVNIDFNIYSHFNTHRLMQVLLSIFMIICWLWLLIITIIHRKSLRKTNRLNLLITTLIVMGIFTFALIRYSVQLYEGNVINLDYLGF